MRLGRRGSVLANYVILIAKQCIVYRSHGSVCHIVPIWVLKSDFVEQRKLDELNYLICGQISTEMSA